MLSLYQRVRAYVNDIYLFYIDYMKLILDFFIFFGNSVSWEI